MRRIDTDPGAYTMDRQIRQRNFDNFVPDFDENPEIMEQKKKFNEIVAGWKKETPDFGDFKRKITDDMTEEEKAEAEKINAKIDKDREEIAARKQKYEKKDLAGRIFETLVKEYFQYHLKSEHIIGVEVMPGNEFDDGQGTDMVIRIEVADLADLQKTAFIYFSLDATVSPNVADLRKNKIFPAAEELEDGILHIVEYFHLKSDERESKGRRQMPHLVIGLSADKVYSEDARPEELYQRFLAYLGDEKGEAVALEKAPFWREFFCQMKSQLVFHLEPCLRAYIHRHLGDEDDWLDDLSGHMIKLQSLSVEKEIDSRQLNDFRQFMAEKRPEISRKDSRLADNLYQHLDLLGLVEKLDEEKSSQEIGLPGALDTENTLEMHGDVKEKYREAA